MARRPLQEATSIQCLRAASTRMAATTSRTPSCRPAAGRPAHVHTREEEAFFVLRGRLTFRLDDAVVEVGPGTFLNVPRGTKHRFSNDSASEAEMIFWFAPAGIEGLFDELGERPQDIVAIGERYGTAYFFGE